jgi:hypothetical protein
MRTALLDIEAWDLVLDVNGNIAIADNPYSLAQDAASAIRTFAGECWYNGTLGIPYFSFFGKSPNLALLRQDMVSQALLVPGVASAQVFIISVVGRKVTGQVQVTDAAGNVTAAAF